MFKHAVAPAIALFAVVLLSVAFSSRIPLRVEPFEEVARKPPANVSLKPAAS